MKTTRITNIAIGLALASASMVSAHIQETKTTTRTHVQMKGGKSVTVTGCLERRDTGDYLLTSIRDVRGTDPSRYALITDADLSSHVGERVRIQGKTVSAGDGTVSVKSETKTDVENGLPFLGVKSLKMLSSSCS